MFSTVRYFIKTSLTFLFIGLLTGVYMSISQYVLFNGNHPSLISAHTHLILVGSVMMMIMGVALWFFPKPGKEDKKYKPALILFTYWVITISTALRFIFQVLDSFLFMNLISYMVTVTSIFQVYSFWIIFLLDLGKNKISRKPLKRSEGGKVLNRNNRH